MTEDKLLYDTTICHRVRPRQLIKEGRRGENETYSMESLSKLEAVVAY